MKRVVVIGSGNVAEILAEAIAASEYDLVQVLHAIAIGADISPVRSGAGGPMIRSLLPKRISI